MTPASATLFVENIGHLITCDASHGDDLGVVDDAVVAADGERILYAGPAADFTGTRSDSCVTIDAGGNAVVPGFVDAHTHLVWMGDRGAEYAQRAAGATYEEIAAAGGGIRSTVAATAAADVETLRDAALPRARRMLRLGTTTVEVKSGYGLTTDAEVRQLRAARALTSASAVPDVVTTYLPLHAAPPGDRQAFLDEVVTRGLPAAAPGARFIDAFCETGAYTVDECARLFDAARAHGLTPKLHTEQRTRTGGALLAARCGAASADHLEHATDDDLAALAKAGVTGVILPGAALVLGGPPPPGRRLIEAGATLAIATDCNPGTCYSESMPLMISLAVATAGITPEQALVAATRGGAAALQLTDRGVIRAGMRCDLSILRTTSWIDLAYHLGGDVVGDVVAGGRLIAAAA